MSDYEHAATPANPDEHISAMRLAISGNGYTSATSSFLDANRLAATTGQTLVAALEDSGAMAGHTAARFAASYDKAAHQGVCALVDLTAALANLGRMTEATRRNHSHAEARAVVGRTAPPQDTAVAPTYAHLTAQLPPSAAGTRGAELPGWAAWILDRIEGFVWPDSDIDRLRATARAWRIASSQLEIVKSHCLDAVLSLSIEIAPDVELASDATRKLATHVDSLAQTFHGLARSCDDLADQVHHHREQVLDIVRDTVRDAVIVEGIGLVLGAVTGGITAAAATSINGTRIAAIAPHIIRIIEALRIAIGASETGARIATESVLQARTSLRAFIDARIITMGSERGCAMPFYWYEALADGTRILKRAPGWLYSHEQPGHTLSKHVGKSVDQLFSRFKREPYVPYSSSFHDYGAAEKFTGAALEARANDIAAWLSGRDRAEKFIAELGTPTGICVDASGRVHVATAVRIVLVRDADMVEGFRVHTSFPEPPR